MVNLLYNNTGIVLTATFVNSLLLALILRNVASRPAIIVWLVCIHAVNLLRFFLVRAYRRAPSQSCTSSSWSTLYIIGIACAGVSWGSAGAFLFPAESMPHQVFMAFVLGGMAAGATTAYAPVKAAFLAFIIPDLLPLILRFLVVGGELHITMALMTVLFLVLILIAALQMHRITLESLQLRFQNDELIVHLKSAKENAESLVDELKSQMMERRQAQLALQKSEQQFRMLIETMNEGLGVYDRKGMITFVNDRACEISGFSRDELLDHPISAFFGDKDQHLYEEQWAKRIAGERGVYEVDLLVKDGRQRPCVISSSPILDEQGVFSGAIVTVTDISTLKDTEKAQRESEKKYRLIFESSPLGIVHSDSNGVITACNDAFAEMLGRSKEDLMGLHIAASLKSEKMHSTVLNCLRGEFEHSMEHLELENGEKSISIKADYSPIASEDGQVSGCIGIVEDITERKRAEQALMDSERKLRILSSQLLSAQEEERKRISHELHDSIGGSLSAIKYSLEKTCDLMEQDAAPTESMKDAIELTQRTIEEARRIYMDLHPSMLEDLGVIATIGWFCRQYQSVYSWIHIEKDISIEENDIPEPLKIVIFRVVQEALHNIAKHSQSEYVDLSLSHSNAAITLAVEDNGSGFDVQPVLSRGSGEKGLGLTSMRERVQLSGGVFSIESTIGKGTVIRASWNCLSPP
jgi:PAS domain S-box-containing protein